MSTEEFNAILEWVGCQFFQLDNGYREVNGERVGGWTCQITTCEASATVTDESWEDAMAKAANQVGYKPEART